MCQLKGSYRGYGRQANVNTVGNNVRNEPANTGARPLGNEHNVIGGLTICGGHTGSGYIAVADVATHTLAELLLQGV